MVAALTASRACRATRRGCAAHLPCTEQNLVRRTPRPTPALNRPPRILLMCSSAWDSGESLRTENASLSRGITWIRLAVRVRDLLADALKGGRDTRHRRVWVGIDVAERSQPGGFSGAGGSLRAVHRSDRDREVACGRPSSRVCMAEVDLRVGGQYQRDATTLGDGARGGDDGRRCVQPGIARAAS